LFTFYSQYMSSLRAMTDRPAGRPAVLFDVNTQATLVRELGQARVPTSASLHTLARECSLSFLAPTFDYPRNDDRAADGGAFMYLY